MQIQEKLQVQNVWVTFKNGTKIGEMYTADYTSEPGDSGSAIYVQQLIMNQLLLVFIKVAVHTMKLILYKLNI